VYYRVYGSHTAVPSKHPVDSNEPSVGRINVNCIPPPHTAKSIIRCISKIEKVEKFGILRLFTSISDESPIGDGHVSILTSNRPGPTPEEPMAFVVRIKRMRVLSQWSQLKFKSRRRYYAHLFARPRLWLVNSQGW
jgi:hypothetical protein